MAELDACIAMTADFSDTICIPDNVQRYINHLFLLLQRVHCYYGDTMLPQMYIYSRIFDIMNTTSGIHTNQP